MMCQRNQRISTIILALWIVCVACSLPLGVRAQESLIVSVTDRDLCDNDTQCLNGGVCADPNEQSGHAHRYCHCAVGYVGDRCNSFCPLDCQNGGYCRYQETAEPSRQYEKDRNPADYMCHCFGLFEGRHCEIAYMNCGDGTRCYNGGACQQPSTQSIGNTVGNARTAAGLTPHTCDCPVGFGGPTCQTVLDILPSSSNVVDQVKEGFQGNKTALICGILFMIIFFAVCSWYCISFCFLEDIVTYESVVVTDTSNDESPRWRNIV